jgi:hypothetical protein
MCEPDWRSRPELLKGINIEAGDIIHPALKESLDEKGGHISQRG